MIGGTADSPTVCLQWGKNGRGLYFKPNPEGGEAIHICYLGAPRDMEYSLTVSSASEQSSGVYVVIVDAAKRRWPGYYNGMYVYNYTRKARYRVLDSYYTAAGVATLILDTIGDFSGINEIADDDILSVESEFPEHMHDLILDYTEMQRWGILKKVEQQQLTYQRLKDKINAMGGNLGGHSD